MENIPWNEIGNDDYLLGKGGFLQEQVGNINFREEFIVPNRERYQATRKTKEKQVIANNVIQEWRNRGGRFLERQDRTGEPQDSLWRDVGDKDMLKRIQQKLCEKQKKTNLFFSPPDTVPARDPPLARSTVVDLPRLDSDVILPMNENNTIPVNDNDDDDAMEIVKEEEEEKYNDDSIDYQDKLKEQQYQYPTMHSDDNQVVVQQQEQQQHNNNLELLATVASEYISLRVNRTCPSEDEKCLIVPEFFRHNLHTW